MGEAKAKNEAVEAAVEHLKQNPLGKEVQLTLTQACSMTALNRSVAMLNNEAQFLAQIGQREVADELMKSADHLQKAQTRFLADTQRSIIVPKAPVLQGLNP